MLLTFLLFLSFLPLIKLIETFVNLYGINQVGMKNMEGLLIENIFLGAVGGICAAYSLALPLRRIKPFLFAKDIIPCKYSLTRSN